MSLVHVHQILNYYTPREALDPGFLVLDNSANERPDWYEYWPMRKFLREEPLDENAFYGFLSPKFRVKTNLSAVQVREFIERAAPETDVFLFSPSIHNSAYHWNVFEHGESEHPGHRSGGAARRARLRFAEYGAFEFFRREAAVLAGLARSQRAAVRDR